MDKNKAYFFCVFIEEGKRKEEVLTARVSVATAVMTNMRLKLMINSRAKAWEYPHEGTVTPPPIKGSNIHFNANDAHREATIWAPIYTGTCIRHIRKAQKILSNVFEVKILNAMEISWRLPASMESALVQRKQWWCLGSDGLRRCGRSIRWQPSLPCLWRLLGQWAFQFLVSFGSR